MSPDSIDVIGEVFAVDQSSPELEASDQENALETAGALEWFTERRDSFCVALSPDQAAALRARAAAHGVTPEVEIVALIESAIQRQAARWQP